MFASIKLKVKYNEVEDMYMFRNIGEEFRKQYTIL